MKILHDRVLKDLNERLDIIQKSISQNSCKTLQEYGHQCGVASGIVTAIDTLKEHFESLNKVSNMDEDFD